MSYSTQAVICYGVLLKDDQYEKWSNHESEEGLEIICAGDCRGDASNILCVKATALESELVREIPESPSKSFNRAMAAAADNSGFRRMTDAQLNECARVAMTILQGRR